MAENQQLQMPGDSDDKHPADVLLKIRTAQINQLYHQTVGGLLGVDVLHMETLVFTLCFSCGPTHILSIADRW